VNREFKTARMWISSVNRERKTARKFPGLPKDISVSLRLYVSADHEKKAQVTTETYKTYIYVSGNNDLLLRNEFCFSFP
jgi:hypothetical protein